MKYILLLASLISVLAFMPETVFAEDLNSAIKLRDNCQQTKRSNDRKDIHDWGSEMLCTGYIAGAVDVLNMSDQGCIPEKAGYGQIVDIFLKYSEENPEKLHKYNIVILIEAINEAFNCKF